MVQPWVTKATFHRRATAKSLRLSGLWHKFHLTAKSPRSGGPLLPSAILANIKKTRDVNTLDEWLGNILDADTLEEVGVPLRK